MPPPPHGGFRPGAGRKPGGSYGEPTRPVRVPESQVETILAWLDAYREPSLARDPQPLDASASLPLVAFTTRVPAGFPSPADEYSESIDLTRELVQQGHAESTFILAVSGWSMIGAGIHDGDRIIVDRALTPVDGDIVVAILGNDLTIKRLGWGVDRQEQKCRALLPENPHFQPTLLQEGDTLEIWGVVTSCLRTFRRGR